MVTSKIYILLWGGCRVLDETCGTSGPCVCEP